MVLSFAVNMVSDLTEKILEITAKYPLLKKLVIHAGADQVMRRQSEILIKDWIHLLNKVQDLEMEVFISRAIPTIWGGDEKFCNVGS